MKVGKVTLIPRDRELRARRPPKLAVDPWQPLGVSLESERRPGGVGPSLTVFLAGSECPFTCIFCDLWRFTLDQKTPVGAIPAQLQAALSKVAVEPAATWIKLYNASNFFDPRAVPPADDPAIAALVAPFARVVVECHPKWIGPRCVALAERLGGRLQVAMGLETIHPEILPRLNKRATLADFAQATAQLRAQGIGVRAFVLLGLPWVSPDEAVTWAVRSAAWAFAQGVEQVALIPLRQGPGELDRLAASSELTLPTLAQVEAALDRCLELDGITAIDLWDFERLVACPACAPARRARLERIQLSGQREPRLSCAHCGSGGA